MQTLFNWIRLERFTTLYNLCNVVYDIILQNMTTDVKWVTHLDISRYAIYTPG